MTDDPTDSKRTWGLVVVPPFRLSDHLAKDGKLVETTAWKNTIQHTPPAQREKLRQEIMQAALGEIKKFTKKWHDDPAAKPKINSLIETHTTNLITQTEESKKYILNIFETHLIYLSDSLEQATGAADLRCVPPPQFPRIHAENQSESPPDYPQILIKRAETVHRLLSVMSHDDTKETKDLIYPLLTCLTLLLDISCTNDRTPPNRPSGRGGPGAA